MPATTNSATCRSRSLSAGVRPGVAEPALDRPCSIRAQSSRDTIAARSVVLIAACPASRAPSHHSPTPCSPFAAASTRCGSTAPVSTLSQHAAASATTAW
uniref:TrbM/KikA/MpfK family conjugal transfer protein n=1 Tax=Saccharomonospora marina TaxID=632569 RepID=UPI0038CD98ED